MYNIVLENISKAACSASLRSATQAALLPFPYTFPKKKTVNKIFLCKEHNIYIAKLCETLRKTLCNFAVKKRLT